VIALSLATFLPAAGVAAPDRRPGAHAYDETEEDRHSREWLDDEEAANLITPAEMRAQKRLNASYGAAPIYSRSVARRVHDRVTVVINESVSASMHTKTDSKSDVSLDMGVDQWFTVGGGKAVSRGNDGKGSRLPFSASNAKKSKGDSKVEDRATFSTELSGQVLEVLPNGFLVIEARKSQTVNQDTKTIIFTGIVDPENLDPGSRVDAKYVIDARIQAIGKGDIARDNQRGFITRIFDRVKPF
jgi:flagellar L-ring protein precursor FlgH